MINRRTSYYLRSGFLVFVILGIILFAVFAYKTTVFLKNIGVVVKEKVVDKPKNTYTVALLGYGGGAHEGAYLTDTIIVAHLNYLTKKAALISIPRDLWVKLPTKSKDPFAAKINTVYQLQLFPETFPDVAVKEYTKNDSKGLIKKVLKDVTGLEVNSYLAIDFAAFKTIIDALDGIDLNLEYGFEDQEYPIAGKENDLCGHKESELPELEKIATQSMVLAFPCRYETISFAAGPNHLDGEMALKFARSRHSEENGGDFARAKRQQMVIEAVGNKLLSPLYFPKIGNLMDKLENQIETDAAYEDITKILKEAPQANQYQLKKLILSTENFLAADYSNDNQYILVPKAGKFQWQKIRAKVKKLTAAD